MDTRMRVSAALCTTLVVLLLAQVAAGAGTTADREVRGTLTEIEGVRVVHLWGSPRDRGFAHGYLLASDIVRLLDGYLGGGKVDGRVLSYQSLALPMTKLMRLSPTHEVELQGVLAGIEARLGAPAQVPALGRTLGYEDLVAINCIPDITSFGCSSFAVWGPLTADGGTLVGRNLDWNRLAALEDSQVVVVHAPRQDPKGLAWLSVTWPGYIGCLTGMNAEGVTACMHDVGAGPPSVMTGFTPRGLALREAIETARAASAMEDVAELLRHRTCAVGNNLPVGRPYHGTAAPSVVFEYDGRLADTKGVTVREPGERFYQLCTNHYVKRAAPRPCDRYETIDHRLAASAEQRKPLDQSGAWATLRSVARPAGLESRLLTYHSVVFEPNARRLHVAFCGSGRPAPANQPATLRLDDLLAPSRFGAKTP